MKKDKIALFEGQQIRRHWDDKKELWYFAIMDVIEVLTKTERPRKYWNDLKTKLKTEGSEVSEKIGQLKMQASDGKYYLTDAAEDVRQRVFCTGVTQSRKPCFIPLDRALERRMKDPAFRIAYHEELSRVAAVFDKEIGLVRSGCGGCPRFD